MLPTVITTNLSHNLSQEFEHHENNLSGNSSILFENDNYANEINDRVILNVGGVRFEVIRSTLKKYPNTKLGKIHLQKPDRRGEYFFDRNPKVFEVILEFYRTGKLSVPSDISTDKIKEELKFFEINCEEAEDDAIPDEEDEEERIRKQPPEDVFNYALSLVIKDRRSIYKAVKLLEELLPRLAKSSQNNTTSVYQNYGDSTYLVERVQYFIAYGYHRLGYSRKAKESLKLLLSNSDQNNGHWKQHATALNVLIDDKSAFNTRVGFAVVVVLCGGGYLAFKNADSIKATISNCAQLVAGWWRESSSSVSISDVSDSVQN